MIRVVAAKHRGQVAQLVEHGPEKAGVGGSSPPLTTLLPSSGIYLPEPPLKQLFFGFLACKSGLSPRVEMRLFDPAHRPFRRFCVPRFTPDMVV